MKSLHRCLRLLALLLFLSSVMSCRHAGVHDALLRAEALMETDPHAARAVLDSLSDNCSLITDHFSQRETALYALLRTQADYKCNVRLTSDSLPLIATNHYGTKRKSQHAALAQYYLGCAYNDMHRDLDAIDALLRATTLFPDTTNKYFANCLFELGLLYSNHHMQDNAWTTFNRYRRTEVCNLDSLNICYADYYMGSVALYQEDIELTDSLFRCVERNTKASDYIRNTAYFQLAKLCYYKKHDIEEAIKYLQKIGNYFGEKNGAILTLKADILSEQQQPEKAFEFYNKAIKYTSDLYIQCSSYEGMASVSSMTDKKDSTRFYIQQYKSLLDTIITLSQKEKIAEIEDMHIVEIHDQQVRARSLRLRLAVGIFIIVLLSAFIITLLLIDRRRKNEKLRFEQELRDIKQRHIEQNIKEELDIEDETPVSESEDDVSNVETTERASSARDDGSFSFTKECDISVPPRLSIQQERVALYRKQFADGRWQRYLEERKVEILSKKYMPVEDADKFRDYLQDLFADVFLDLVNENANVTRPDLEYCAMTLLGFNTATIAYCARVSLHSLHNRRYHIKDKLTPDWYTIIFASPK